MYDSTMEDALWSTKRVLKMEWRTISKFPSYEVSDDGDIRNKRTGKILKPYTDPLQEYDRVTIWSGVNKKRKVMVHILVAEAFLGPRPHGMEIDHINTFRNDNRAKNLRYVTRYENANNPISVYKRMMRKLGEPLLF
jgi:hypothetical protein